MNIEVSPKHPEPEASGSGYWHRFGQWLGAVGSTSQREDHDKMSEQDSGKAQSDEDAVIDQIASEATKQAVELAIELRRSDPSAPQPGFAPDFLLGPQSYSDPSVWGPPGETKPLTLNEEYGKLGRVMDEMNERLGITSSEP